MIIQALLRKNQFETLFRILMEITAARRRACRPVDSESTKSVLNISVQDASSHPYSCSDKVHILLHRRTPVNLSIVIISLHVPAVKQFERI
jgi:hypothetical protein